MKEFTAEMLDTLSKANESVKGTDQYGKYYMEMNCKDDKGKWFFVGWNIPYSVGTLKKYKGNTYIITLNARFHVTDAVKELLGI